MKKIGIITINDNTNYGNRLQNYALETAIRKFDFQVETVILPKKNYFKRKIKAFKKKIRVRFNKQIFFKLKTTQRKTEIFAPISNKYLNNVKYNKKDIFDEFDRFIVGSDQVWNPSWTIVDNHWLRFVPKEKRFSYAASMATTQCKPKNKNKLIKYLQEMNEISVREADSVPFIKRIAGRDVRLVVDPTMLLTKEEYLSLVEKEKDHISVIDRDYILVYALVGLPVAIQERINKLAEERNYKIIKIMGKLYDEKDVVYNWIEFIQAVNMSKFVVSDSFHCGVFSVIMNTPFLLFNRTDGAKMSSRLDTLLSTFKLLKNRYDDKTDFQKLIDVDFEESNKILSEKRQEGLAYLEYILHK